MGSDKITRVISELTPLFMFTFHVIFMHRHIKYRCNLLNLAPNFYELLDPNVDVCKHILLIHTSESLTGRMKTHTEAGVN